MGRDRRGPPRPRDAPRDGPEPGGGSGTGGGPGALAVHLGPALRLLRRERGLKQRQVARRAGVTKSMVSAYELGRRLPALETLARLLVGLQASLADLEDAVERVDRLRRRGLLEAAAGSAGGGSEPAGGGREPGGGGIEPGGRGGPPTGGG